MVKPLGGYMARVYQGQATCLAPVGPGGALILPAGGDARR